MSVSKFLRGLSPGEKFAASLSLLLHGITAVVSFGHLYSDEHTQILLFLQHRIHPEQAMPYVPMELSHQMRPWLQPFLYAAIQALSPIQDPFDRATLLRVLTALVGFVSVFFLYVQLKRPRAVASGESDRMLLFLCFGLWFWPFFHARLSAETFGMILMTFVAGLVFARPAANEDVRATLLESTPRATKRLIAIAALLGFASVARPPVGILAAVIALGVVIAAAKKGGGRAALRVFGILLSVGVASELVGIAIDRWGYGNWVITPWNYFKVNFVDGYLAGFYNRPGWFYAFSLSLLLLPWSLWVVPTFFLNLRAQWRSSLSWTVGIFVAFHCLISNKQERFLLPVLPLVVVLLHRGWVIGADGHWKNWARNPMVYRATQALNAGMLVLLASVVWCRQAVVLKAALQFAVPGMPIVYDTQLDVWPYVITGVYDDPNRTVIHRELGQVGEGSFPPQFVLVESALRSTRPPDIACEEVEENAPRFLRSYLQKWEPQRWLRQLRFFRIARCRSLP